jgi:phenylpyruvate tautomerase PptA (4-oxalocrotonate tautomerase family)
MPLYTAITQDGTVSVETLAKIAAEITRIHSTVMKVPKSFVRVIFLSYPAGSGFTGGEQAPTASLNCVLRSGHTPEERRDMLQQLWVMFQDLTGIATEQLAISLQEIPSSNAMEMGQIMQAVGHE